ncbi:MAG: hypothetical protein AMJ46_01375 [Latescibacteria bacterium DG_63]|nr:MAG: hypothetical protein AMJ46_01375 [Latescibacteria bacterium DG_63]
MKLPKIMLGSNPFHGVSYRSAEERKEFRRRFKDVDSVYKVMERSAELGIRGFHSYAKDVEIRAIVKLREKFGDSLTIVSILPDIYGAMSRQVGGDTQDKNLTKIKMLVKNMPSLISAGMTGNLVPMVDSILKTELAFIKETRPNFILLHGTLADMACVTDQKRLLDLFKERVLKAGAIPGMTTHNMGTVYRKLKEMSVHFPVIEAPFNPKGFMMQPSAEKCLEIRNEARDVHFIGKKILAGGSVAPESGLLYAYREAKVESTVIGIGSVSEAEETFGTAKEILGEEFDAVYDITTT